MQNNTEPSKPINVYDFIKKYNSQESLEDKHNYCIQMLSALEDTNYFSLIYRSLTDQDKNIYFEHINPLFKQNISYIWDLFGIYSILNDNHKSAFFIEHKELFYSLNTVDLENKIYCIILKEELNIHLEIGIDENQEVMRFLELQDLGVIEKLERRDIKEKISADFFYKVTNPTIFVLLKSGLLSLDDLNTFNADSLGIIEKYKNAILNGQITITDVIDMHHTMLSLESNSNAELLINLELLTKVQNNLEILKDFMLTLDNSSIDFGQSSLAVRLMERYGGLCDVICNYLTLSNISQNSPQMLYNSLFPTESSTGTSNKIDIDSIEKVARTHILETTGFLSYLRYYFTGEIPNNIFSPEEQNNLITSEGINIELLRTKLESLPIGAHTKYSVFHINKWLGIPDDGHSILICKKNTNQYIFVDPADSSAELLNINLLLNAIQDNSKRYRNRDFHHIAFIDNDAYINQVKENLNNKNKESCDEENDTSFTCGLF